MVNLVSIIKSATIRQSGITFIGTFATGILGLAFSILIARALGPESFGVFSFIVTTMTLLATVGDFGTNTGIVRFVGKYIKDDRTKAFRFMKFALEIKLASWISILILGLGTSSLVATNFLGKPELIFPLRVAYFGFGALLLFSFVSFCLQAIGKYWTWSFLGVAMNFLRILIALLLFRLVGLTELSGVGLYVSFPLLGFLVGLVFLPAFWRVKEGFLVAKEFISYNKWVALFGVIASVTARVDTFLITRFLTLTDIGIYSVALNLSSIVPQIVFAVAVVAAPKLAQFSKRSEAILYLKKLQLLVIGLAVLGMVVGVPLAYLIIPVLYGPMFIGSLLPFVVLLGAQAIFLISVPAHTSIFYYFSQPKFFVVLEIIHLIVVFISSWILISGYGILGAALAILIGNIVNFLIPSVWVLFKFRKKK